MQPNSAKQIFDFFPGVWKIARWVTAEIPAQNAIAHGYGLFTVSKENPCLILYSEKVTLHPLQSHTTHIGKQQYQYIYDMANASLSKHFYDGRLLYRFNLLDGQINGAHLCIQDRYVSKYIFEADRFSVVYMVDGPLKHYRITSVYTPIPDNNCIKKLLF